MKTALSPPYLILLGCFFLGCEISTPPITEKAVNEDIEEFVGDEVCATCHEELYLSYHQTGMGRSVTQFNPSTAPESFDPPVSIYNTRFDYYYEPILRGDSLYQREYRLDAEGKVVHEQIYAAEWVIGSGNGTRSYLMNVNGHVTEMPLTWYVRSEKWDLSPSYEQQNFRFGRAISLECMGCHNGRPVYSNFTQGHYEEVPLGITCERCHGAGGQHSDLRLAGINPPNGESDPSIVNPGNLERSLQLSVCQQCHLTGVAVFGPGEDMTTFKPGTALRDHRTVYATEEELTDPERFGIASHAMRLSRSECFEKSEMTCVTCHDPHQSVTTLDANHFNDACNSCHDLSRQQTICIRPEASTSDEAMTGNCVGCHLQKSGTSDIPHVTFTDHWIRRTVPEAVSPEEIQRELVRTTPFKLVAVDEDVEDDTPDALVEEGMAYFQFYETRHKLPSYLPDIAAKIREGLERGAEHEEGRLVLARALMEMDSLSTARLVLQEAVLQYPDHARLHYWLGFVELSLNDPERAATALSKSLDISPHFNDARLKYAESLSALGRYDEAESELLTLLDDDPVHLPEARNNLGFLYMQTERLEEALPRFLQATALDPDLETAWTNAGTIELLQENFEAAAGYFERALEANESYVPALGNLGLVYRQLGRFEEARQVLTRLIAIYPDDARAWELLRQLEEER